MKEIAILAGVSAVILCGFIVAIFFCVLKRKRKFILAALFSLVLLAFFVSWTIFLVAGKSYNKVTTILKPRTGKEIYTALFGETFNECLNVLDQQDQIVPIIDTSILLLAQTCPEELKRILALHSYDMVKRSTADLSFYEPAVAQKRFNVRELGDSVFVFSSTIKENKNWQTIYSSLDSTIIICIDVL